MSCEFPPFRFLNEQNRNGGGGDRQRGCSRASGQVGPRLIGGLSAVRAWRIRPAFRGLTCKYGIAYKKPGLREVVNPAVFAAVSNGSLPPALPLRGLCRTMGLPLNFPMLLSLCTAFEWARASLILYCAKSIQYPIQPGARRRRKAPRRASHLNSRSERYIARGVNPPPREYARVNFW